MIPVPRRGRIPDRPAMDPVLRGRMALSDFARCAVDKDYGTVLKAVALPPGPAFNRTVTKLAASDCLANGELRFSPPAIRGPLFKELYVRRALGKGARQNLGPAVPPLALTASVEMDDGQRQHIALLAFASCVIEQEPSGAREVALASIGSAQEDKAVKALVPHLSACLSQGSTMKLDKLVIEGALAEVLYRGMAAPVATSFAPEGE